MDRAEESGSVSDVCGDQRLFEMGLHKAYFPTHLRYVSTHFWFEPVAETGRYRCGISAYAARLLTDLFRIDWNVRVGQPVQLEDVLGEVESTKASSELYSPLSATLTAVNAAAVDDPSQVSLEPYAHWLLEFDGQPGETMGVDEYVKYLEAGWDETVKMLKGQA